MFICVVVHSFKMGGFLCCVRRSSSSSAAAAADAAADAAAAAPAAAAPAVADYGLGFWAWLVALEDDGENLVDLLDRGLDIDEQERLWRQCLARHGRLSSQDPVMAAYFDDRGLFQ